MLVIFSQTPGLPLVSQTPTKRSTGRVKLGDVAREAGVSPITVSRSLRGIGGVSVDVAQRVRELAATMGYVPDVAARALASRHSSHVPLLVPMLSNNLFVDLIEAIHHVLSPAGYHPMIGVTHYDHDEEESLLRSYLAHRPAGLLLTGFDRSETSRRLIEASAVPCVHMMELSQSEGVYSVGFSQQEAGAAITQHLLSRGRKRIAFIAAQLDPRTLERADGYRSCLQNASLYDPQLELLSPEPSSFELGADLLQQLLAARPDVDAVFFCNDDLALGGLALARRLGIDVPARMAIAGFNDLAGAGYSQPALTTVRTPRAEVGAHAAEMLLTLIQGREPAVPRLELPYEVIVRDST